MKEPFLLPVAFSLLQSGKTISLYVTVNDGKVTVKNEVAADVRPPGSAGSGASRRPPRPPNFPPQLGAGGVTHLRPPSLFPPFPTNYPANFVPPNVPSAPVHGGIPSVNPGPPPSLPGAGLSRPPFPRPSLPPRPVLPSTGGDGGNGTDTGTSQSTTPSSPADATTPQAGVGAGGSSGSGDAVATPSLPDSLLVTSLLSVLCIGLVLAGVLVLLRRRLCPRKLTKASKEDLRKESSGLSSALSSGLSSSGLSSSGLSGDEPMAMQQWRGPRAFSNRYEGWERDAGSVSSRRQTLVTTLEKTF